jgi:hypothetical protein
MPLELGVTGIIHGHIFGMLGNPAFMTFARSLCVLDRATGISGSIGIR